MARFRALLSSFLAGEISPRLWGKTDSQSFKDACEEMTNMWILPQGGASRRTGSQFMTSNFTTDDKAGLKSFTYIKSKTESYIIIFSTDTTNHEFGVRVWDVTNKVFLTVTNTTLVDPGYSMWEGFSTAAELEKIQMKDFGNAVFFAHEDYPPFGLDFATVQDDGVYIFPFWAFKAIGQRDSVGDLLTLGPDDYADAWPYQSRNADDTTEVSISHTTGSGRTLTANNPIFTADHVGSLIRVTGDTALTTGVALITDYIGANSVEVTVLRAFEDTNVTDNFAFSSWSNAVGWPRAINFFESRLYYGFIESDPAGFWGSKSGDLSFMRQEQYIDETPFGVTNADAWSSRLSGADAIQWIDAGKTLLFGCLSKEHIGKGPDETLSLGPLNFQFYSETSHGSSQVQPIRRDSVVIFIQRSGKMVREMSFNFSEDTFIAPKVMNLAEHMVRRTQDDAGAGNTYQASQIVEIVHQEADSQITWFRDNYGGIFGMSRDRELESRPTGFHYHKIAGFTVTTQCARILTMCVAPSEDGTHDDLYIFAKRLWGDDTDQVYMERLGREYLYNTIYNPAITDIQEKPIYMDSAKMSIEGSPTLVHSGFDHLYNCPQDVQVIADGHYVGVKTVSAAGEITLDYEATEVIAGMKYRSQLITTQINMGSVLGTSQGAKKTADNMFINFINTIGGVFGLVLNDVVTEDELQDIEFRDPNANMNDPIEPFTGLKEITPPQGWDNKVNILIRQDLPFPQQVASVVYPGITND